MNMKDESGSAIDVEFMKVALLQAERARDAGEVPIGAVVIKDGEILGVGANSPISHCDPTAHAEVLALRQAALRLENYRLPGCTVYVTVEPCLMCLGALLHARISRLVFGCREPKTGALYRAGAFDPVASMEVTEGVCAAESVELLQAFFKARRGA